MWYHLFGVFVTVVALAACSGGGSSADVGPDTDDASAVDAGDDAPDARDVDAAQACDRLYGNPVEQTGLSGEECSPVCPSCGPQAAPSLGPELRAYLRGLQLIEGPAEVVENPYATDPAPVPRPDDACAVVWEEDGYRLQTFEDPDAVELAGATLTHHGACGTCSTLQDLATYAEYPDLTAPVRECGFEGISDGAEANIACLTDLGFTLPCAQTWYYNTLHTRSECLELCLAALNEPYHLEDGSLNPCLQCDEEKSGPVFKATAGRTRRNSGLASAICRPCGSVRPVAHEYR